MAKFNLGKITVTIFDETGLGLHEIDDLLTDVKMAFETIFHDFDSAYLYTRCHVERDPVYLFTVWDKIGNFILMKHFESLDAKEYWERFEKDFNDPKNISNCQ